MPSPLVVDVLREQLLRVLDWYGRERPPFAWGVVIHRRNERGRLRFGAVTPAGESLVLSEPLLADLLRLPCWLDGAVPVKIESRGPGQPQSWVEAIARVDRPPLVDALAVYFDPDASAGDAESFKAMAGVLTPSTIPSELFLLTRERPSGWPL